MKKIFVALGGIGFLVFSGLIILVVDDLPSTCFDDIVNCKPNFGMLAFFLFLNTFSYTLDLIFRD